MHIRVKSLAAGLLAVALAAPVLAEDAAGPSTDMVVATVNGVDITLGQMILVREALPDQYKNLPDNVLWDGILDQLVQQEVLAETQKAEGKRVNIALQNEKRGLLAAQAAEAVAKASLNDDAVRKAYDEMYGGDQGEEYNASHILVETEDEAKALIKDLEGGADFAQLARDKSTGPSGPNGGELGWFGQGQMVEPFETAVAQMNVGDVSAPVKTQFGWHVIKLNDKRAKSAPPLDEVRAEVEAKVQKEAVGARIDELVKGAQITRKEVEEVDPTLLRRIDLFEE